MNREIDIHVDLDGKTHLVGRLWSRLSKGHEGASFAYDPAWLKSPLRFPLEPALSLDPGTHHIPVNPQFSNDLTQGRASSLTKIEPPVEAVLVYVNRPQTMEAVEDCLAAKIPMVWLHDALSPGAAIPAAIDKLRSAGCAVIPGLCPMFYLRPVDPAHFCLKWMLRLSGKEKRARQISG